MLTFSVGCCVTHGILPSHGPYLSHGHGRALIAHVHGIAPSHDP